MFEDASKTKAFVKVALYGDGGSGKTRFLLSFPKVAVVDTEAGTNAYRGKYQFKVKHANRWKQLGDILDHIEANPDACETLAIDSLTVFYQDLINDMMEHVKNKRGHEILSQLEWTIIKRRWSAFLNRLIDLRAHVVLSMREKEEFEETTNSKGEEVRRKTGNHLMDADKQTKYIFDLVLRCYTEENRKAKESKFLVRVDKTRYDWMPKYGVYDVTGKRAFETLFVPHMAELESGIPARPRGLHDEGAPPPAVQDAPKNGDVPAAGSAAESVGDLLQQFAGPAIDPSQPPASGEDIKVLMTRCGQMTWTNGEKFKSSDGKALIKALFKIEASKELRKTQVDWLYAEFGKVLAGQSILVRDEKGIPFIAAAQTAPAAP